MRPDESLALTTMVRRVLALGSPRAGAALLIGEPDEALFFLHAWFERVYGLSSGNRTPSLLPEGIELLHGKPSAIPLPENSVDVVITGGVLEKAPLREVRRICAESVRVSRRYAIWLGAIPGLLELQRNEFPELQLVHDGSCFDGAELTELRGLIFWKPRARGNY